MKKITAIFLFSGFISNLAHATESTFSIDPTIMMTEEDHAVMLSVAVDCQASNCPKSVELVQWKDETRQESKARWQLQDRGLYGDKKSGDHIYSQQIYLQKNQPGVIYFTAAGTYQGQVQVAARPTFMEELKMVWEKMKERF